MMSVTRLALPSPLRDSISSDSHPFCPHLQAVQGQLYKEEGRHAGIVTWQTYKDYAKLAGSGLFLLIAVVLLFGAQV